MEHALDCRVGGLVCQRHNEVRDAICDLASFAWGQVQKEPVVCEEKMDDPSSETLIADVRIRGVWQYQVDAFLMFGLLTQMLLHINLVRLRLSFALLKLRKGGSMVLLVWRVVPVSRLCAFL